MDRPLLRLIANSFGFILMLGSFACQTQNNNQDVVSVAHQKLLSRATMFELETQYVPPPGDPLEHHTAGFAKILCSAVFISGLDPDFAAESIGYFTSPYAERSQVVERVVDHEEQEVHLTLPSGVVRTAKYYGDQGCVTLPVGERAAYFTPTVVESVLPEPSTQAWPMGDMLLDTPLSAEIDIDVIEAAVDAAFDPVEGLTAAFLVTWRGRIIGERYRAGISMHTPLESWSMGKSLSATLMGVLIQQGVYDLWQPAPLEEWQEEGDARSEIRIADLLHTNKKQKK